MYLPFADIYTNFYAIVLAGVCTGVIGRFFGISGSFLLTPLLNVLGFPMAFAVGTNLTHFFGRSVLTTVKNNAFSHVNWKIGIIIGLTGAVGIHLGKVLMLSLEEIGMAGVVSRTMFMTLLFSIVMFMTWEHFRSKKAENPFNIYARISAGTEKIRRINIFPMISLPYSGGKSISLWFLVALGVVTGLLSGVLGLSGSFIRLPALVFLTGLPLLSALCTDLLVTIISLGLGAAGFASSGHAEIVAAMLLLLSSGIGSHLGHMATKCVNRVRAKQPFIASVTAVFAGVGLKHLGYDTMAATLMLGSVFVLSSTLVLAMVGASLRETRTSVGFPVGKSVAPGDKSFFNL